MKRVWRVRPKGESAWLTGGRLEDIVDTGHTVHYLMENLATRHPASIPRCMRQPRKAARCR